MNRRWWNVVAATLLALVLGGLGGSLPIPMVALGPGPTYDTLDAVSGVATSQKVRMASDSEPRVRIKTKTHGLCA